MRRRLPEGVRMYSGDDFNYPDLIAGAEAGYSHAAGRPCIWPRSCGWPTTRA
jgi:hypothetical protein